MNSERNNRMGRRTDQGNVMLAITHVAGLGGDDRQRIASKCCETHVRDDSIVDMEVDLRFKVVSTA